MIVFYSFRSVCLPKNCKKELETSDESQYLLKGTGEFKTCVEHLETALIKSGKVSKASNGRMYFPKIHTKNFSSDDTLLLHFKMHPKMEFDAFSEFYYASNDFFHYQKPFNFQNTKLYLDIVSVAFVLILLNLLGILSNKLFCDES